MTIFLVRAVFFAVSLNESNRAEGSGEVTRCQHNATAPSLPAAAALPR